MLSALLMLPGRVGERIGSIMPTATAWALFAPGHVRSRPVLIVAWLVQGRRGAGDAEIAVFDPRGLRRGPADAPTKQEPRVAIRQQSALTKVRCSVSHA